MAEEATNAPVSQTPQSDGAGQAVAQDLPEADLDSLLSRIPGFESLFGESQESGKAEAKKELAPQGTVEVPAVPEEMEITLPAAEPLVEEEPAPPAQQPAVEVKPDAVQKRIDQLTAQKKTAEERAQALEAELSDLKSKAK